MDELERQRLKKQLLSLQAQVDHYQEVQIKQREAAEKAFSQFQHLLDSLSQEWLDTILASTDFSNRPVGQDLMTFKNRLIEKVQALVGPKVS